MKQEMEILNKLTKPLKLEIKKGAKNQAVIGGFDKYMINWSQQLLELIEDEAEVDLIKELQDIFKDYQSLEQEERLDKLAQAKEIIDNLKRDSKVNKSSVQQKFPDFWTNEVRFCPGVGKQRAKKLERLGITKVSELLYYFPRDYNDWSDLKKISQLKPEIKVTVTGRVNNIEELRPRKGLKIIKVSITDGTGSLNGVWFNQSYIKRNFKMDEKYLFSGTVKYSYGQWEISNPYYEKLADDLKEGVILPTYSSTKGISQRFLRGVIANLLAEYRAQIREVLPKEIINKYKFPDLKRALKMIHQPESTKEIKIARQRFAYEELFMLQLGLALRKNSAKNEQIGIEHKSNEELLTEFLSDLEFELTEAQKRVWQEIRDDMSNEKIMNRLLQGDVGAGKTVIATLALLKTIESNYQGALMAPTEILAEQHYLKLKDKLAEFNIDVALLVGSLKKREKEDLLKEIAAGEVDLVIGTHALIQDAIDFNNLGLIVIDEQHRFGVKQRAKLQEKGNNCDVLVMTATPIPRTLALTVYGDLDVSTIDQLPPGRKPIVTEWRRSSSRSQIYQFVKRELNKGRQAYVVCPLIEESEKLDLEAATELYTYLSETEFKDFNLGLLHGKMKAAEKEEMMESFRDGTVDILVSTTVIEVGVDVANASLMIIEDAQRFGLAQLHQLRGRVGRGKYQSYCILIAEPSTDKGKKRMKIMGDSNDGFVIAEEDLYLRGPGEFFGTRQHGMPDLKVADILRDQKILKQAREDAFRLVANSPKLNQHSLLKKYLQNFFNYDFELIDIS